MKTWQKNQNNTRPIWLVLIMALFILIMALTQGCTETQKRPVWGKGDLPADYQTTFGNTNPSRLNYVQQQQIDKHAKVIAELARRVIAIEAVDPNEVAVEELPNAKTMLMIGDMLKAIEKLEKSIAEDAEFDLMVARVLMGLSPKRNKADKINPTRWVGREYRDRPLECEMYKLLVRAFEETDDGASAEYLDSRKMWRIHWREMCEPWK